MEKVSGKSVRDGVTRNASKDAGKKQHNKKTRTLIIVSAFLMVLVLVCYVYLPRRAHENSRVHTSSHSSHFSERCLEFEKCLLADCPCVSSAVRDINHALYPLLKDILRKAFFRYFKVHLDRECPLDQREPPMCMISQCAVEECPFEEIPEVFISQDRNELSKINFEPIQKGSWHFANSSSKTSGYEVDNVHGEDFCVRDDYLTEGSVYVNLLRNPERYTGYEGLPARRIWEAIYVETCFSNGNSKTLTRDASYQCSGQKIFHKLISGFHSSITAHIAWQYLDRQTNTWTRNATIYETRLEKFPERVKNLEFLYLFVLRAISKLAPTLDQYNFCSSDPIEDSTIEMEVKSLGSFALKNPELFYGDLMISDEHTRHAHINYYKHHFKKISRIMNCVSCEKCRLWGKLQTLGIGTALKVVFSYQDTMPKEQKLGRSELVALINLMGQLSTSVSAIEYFENQNRDQLPHLTNRSLYEQIPKNECLLFLAGILSILFTYKFLRR